MTDDVRIRVRVDDDTSQGLRSAQQSTGGFVDKIKGGLSSLGPAAAVAGGAIAAGLAAATMAAGLLKKALDASIERTAVGGLMAAQLGDTDHVGELGKLAGKVYADNFGESLQEAGTAVRDVIRSRLVPEDAADDAIKAVAEKVLTIAQVTEATSTEVSRSVHKMLVTGLAGSAEEALDLIARGVQQGANEADDLLDTFDEYSIQFKELGLSGKEALGLISQGLRNGARDADTVADALKELAIRAQDGSKGSLDAFKALGLNGKQLSTMFSSGGEQARKALDMVIDKTKGITDPMQKNAIAVGLFGTKAEDLQDALFGLDLDTAAAGLGDIAGAADKAAAAIGTGLGPMLETFKRKAQQAFADIGDKIAPQVIEAIEMFRRFGSEIAHVFDGSEVPGKVMDSLKELAHNYLPAVKQGLHELVDKVRENKDTFETIGHILADYVIPIIGTMLVGGVGVAVAMIKDFIDTLGMATSAAREMYNQLKPVAIGIALLFVNTFDQIVTAAARAFGWVPGIGPKLQQAAKEVHEFVVKVNNELKNIRDQDVYVRTHFVGGQGQSRGGEFRTGGIMGAAAGGIHSGLRKVGEEGEEYVRLPQGAMVYPHANTMQMQAMAGQGGGGGGGAVLIGSDGSRLGNLLIDVLGEAMRAKGGRPELLGLRLA